MHSKEDVKQTVEQELKALQESKIFKIGECLEKLQATDEFKALLDFYFVDELVRLNDLAHSSSTKFSEYADVHKESIANSMTAIAEFKEFINAIPKRTEQIQQQITDKIAFLERK